MMSQVKNCKLLAVSLGLFALVLTGCKDKNKPTNPYLDPGDTENPNWVITVENDMTSSLTAVVKVSFTSHPGTLAAFIGKDCCGIGEYKSEYGLYWLYISPASEAGGEVQLRFYSPDLKRIFEATSTFPFQNDGNIGSISEPHTPSWALAQ